MAADPPKRSSLASHRNKRGGHGRARDESDVEADVEADGDTDGARVLVAAVLGVRVGKPKNHDTGDDDNNGNGGNNDGNNGNDDNDVEIWV